MAAAARTETRPTPRRHRPLGERAFAGISGAAALLAWARTPLGGDPGEGAAGAPWCGTASASARAQLLDGETEILDLQVRVRPRRELRIGEPGHVRSNARALSHSRLRRLHCHRLTRFHRGWWPPPVTPIHVTVTTDLTVRRTTSGTDVLPRRLRASSPAQRALCPECLR